MTEKESFYIFSLIWDEGFDYAFDPKHTDWSSIKDKKFHNLRLLYLPAKEDLTLYLEQQHGPTN